MEINIKDEDKIVEIWLTNTEKNDPVLREKLKGLYSAYKSKKYLVAVFESGEKDLYEGTLELLLYNKRRIAELEVRQERKQREEAER